MAKLSGLESERTISGLEREKENFLCCVHQLLKTCLLPSPSLLLKLPIFVIQKCYSHGNVTSHFSLLHGRRKKAANNV